MESFWDLYGGEILVAIVISTILGFVGMVRAFFSRIKKMEGEIDELKAEIKKNTEFDQHRQTVVDLIHSEMIKGK